MRCYNCHKELTKDFYDEYESIVKCEYCGELNSLSD